MSSDTQIELTKLYCQLHPHQLLTNYCNDEKCLVGLCATCICVHTQIHANLGTLPRYQNIRNTFQSLRDQLKYQIQLIADNKFKLANVKQSVQNQKKMIRKTIKQLKEETIDKVKKQFDLIERKIMDDVKAEEKKQGYHCSIRLENLQNLLLREKQNLLKYTEKLNCSNFLQIAKELKKSALIEAENNRFKIQKQLEDNQIYAAHLKWGKNFLIDIENSIRKIFSLQFVIPKTNGQVTNFVTPLRQNGIKINTIIRSNSQPKLSFNLPKNSALAALSKLSETSYSNFLLEGEKNILKSLERQSLLRKCSFNTNLASDCGFMREKQNIMNQGYMTKDCQTETKSIVINNQSFNPQPNYPDRLSGLIEAKRNSQFDKPWIPMMKRQDSFICRT